MFFPEAQYKKISEHFYQFRRAFNPPFFNYQRLLSAVYAYHIEAYDTQRKVTDMPYEFRLVNNFLEKLLKNHLKSWQVSEIYKLHDLINNTSEFTELYTTLYQYSTELKSKNASGKLLDEEQIVAILYSTLEIIVAVVRECQSFYKARQLVNEKIRQDIAAALNHTNPIMRAGWDKLNSKVSFIKEQSNLSAEEKASFIALFQEEYQMSLQEQLDDIAYRKSKAEKRNSFTEINFNSPFVNYKPILPAKINRYNSIIKEFIRLFGAHKWASFCEKNSTYMMF